MNTRLLFGLLLLTPALCFGALSTDTSYFLNVEALTNVTARSAVRGLTGVLTNGLTAGTGTFTGMLSGQAIVGTNLNLIPFTTPTRLIFDGDSLTCGTAGTTNFGYPTYFTNLVTANVTFASNAAVTAVTITNRITNYTASISPYKPSGGTNAVLFAWMGINNVTGMNADQIYESLTNYWRTAKADGFTLVAFTITEGAFNNTLETVRRKANDLIRVSPYWDYLVDTAQLFPTSSGVTSDNIHFTTNYNRVISDQVIKIVQQPPRTPSNFGYDLNAVMPYVNYLSALQVPGGIASFGAVAFSPNHVAEWPSFTKFFGGLVNGDIRFQNAAGTDFGMMQYGGTTASFPAHGRNGTGMTAVVADNSAPTYYLSTRQVTAKTSDYPLVAASATARTSTDVSKLFTNEGASAIVNFTLPGAAAGYTYTFVIQDADGLTVTAAAGDTIRIAGSVTGAAGNIQATTIGNTVTLCAINATEWIALSHEGTWTVSAP